mgnify:CR=1 FL=1
MDGANGVEEGAWDSIHLVTTTIDGNNKAKYRLNSNVFLFVKDSNDKQGKLDMGGQLLKVKEDYVNINPKMDI